MADELGQTFGSGVTSEDMTEHGGDAEMADIADMMRVRRAVLEALERELSEFLNNASL